MILVLVDPLIFLEARLAKVEVVFLPSDVEVEAQICYHLALHDDGFVQSLGPVHGPVDDSSLALDDELTGGGVLSVDTLSCTLVPADTQLMTRNLSGGNTTSNRPDTFMSR